MEIKSLWAEFLSSKIAAKQKSAAAMSVLPQHYSPLESGWANHLPRLRNRTPGPGPKTCSIFLVPVVRGTCSKWYTWYVVRGALGTWYAWYVIRVVCGTCVCSRTTLCPRWANHLFRLLKQNPRPWPKNTLKTSSKIEELSNRKDQRRNM